MKNKKEFWQWVDTYEAMEILHCSRSTLYNLAKRGYLQKSKLGNRCYYNLLQIEETLRRNIICEDGSLDNTMSPMDNSMRTQLAEATECHTNPNQ